jgi:hypothetical protein
MKNFKHLLYGIALAIFTFACQPQDTVINQNNVTSTDVYVQNGMLVFKSTDTYEKAIQNLASPNQAIRASALPKIQGFVSLKEAFQKTNAKKPSHQALIDSDILNKILNKDATIQIAQWIFKISPQKERVFVLPQSHYSQANYTDLIQERKNPHIYSFPDRYSVLDLLEQGITTVEDENGNEINSILCGGGISNGRSIVQTPIVSCSNQFPFPSASMEAEKSSKIDYTKFGIYFEADLFIGTGIWNLNNSPQSFIDYCFTTGTHSKKYFYETTCRNSWSRNIDEVNVPFIENFSWIGSEWRERIYQGSRALRCLRVEKFDVYTIATNTFQNSFYSCR